MAKNNSKKKKTAPSPRMSPERYIVTTARTLPVDKCYWTPGFTEHGVANVVITRRRPSGNLVAGCYLVDTWCMGIKNIIYRHNITRDELDELLGAYTEGLVETTYANVHNLLLGAIEFAREAEIEPAAGWSTAGYILDEDTDDIELIEFEYGRDGGKHVLLEGPTGRERRLVDRLTRLLGDDFVFIPADFADDGIDDEAADILNTDYPEEPHHFDHPDYPATIEVTHPVIAEAMLSHDNYLSIPDEVIDTIMALPRDEAIADISAVALYEIGRTYRAIDDDTIGNPENGAILHALYLLTEMADRRGFDTVVTIMRQSENFLEYHLGDVLTEDGAQAFCRTAAGDLDALMQFIETPGVFNYARGQAIVALVLTAVNDPSRRDEIVERLGAYIDRIIPRLETLDACDPLTAAETVSAVIDLHATELTDRVKAIYATGMVDKGLCGSIDNVVKEIEKPATDSYPRPYIPIKQQYRNLLRVAASYNETTL